MEDCHSGVISLLHLKDENEMVVGFGDGTIKLYDIHPSFSSMNLKQDFEKKHSKWIKHLLRVGKNLIASASGDSRIMLWSRSLNEKQFRHSQTLEQGHTNWVFKLVDLSPLLYSEQKSQTIEFMMASCSNDYTIIVWHKLKNEEKFQKRQVLEGQFSGFNPFRKCISDLIFIQDKCELISASFDQTITVCSFIRNQFDLIQTLKTNSSVWSIVELKTSQRVASGQRDGSIIIWGKKEVNGQGEYERKQKLTGYHSIYAVNCLMELKAMNGLVTGSYGCKINIFFYDTNKEKYFYRQTLDSHTGWIECLIDLANKSDESLFASASRDNSIKIWSSLSTETFCSKTFLAKSPQKQAPETKPKSAISSFRKFIKHL